MTTNSDSPRPCAEPPSTVSSRVREIRLQALGHLLVADGLEAEAERLERMAKAQSAAPATAPQGTSA